MRNVVAAALILASATIALAQRPQPGVIRARISVVPIDVRGVHRKGNPVTDPKQEDFTVLEDGVPQPIQHFELQTLSPDPAAATAAVDLKLDAEAYARFVKEGASYTARVPLANYPKHVKVVVYNYVTDLLGTASIMVY
jgi:hypothetical protein